MQRFWFFLIISLFFSLIFSGCSPAPVKYNSHFVPVVSYRDVPGVTQEEIDAIEALKKSKVSFSYGALLSTEVFIQPDGTYNGFSTKFTELLSELFGIKFHHTLYEWDELMNRFEARSLDFTGELTATEERGLKYFMTAPIAERLLRIFMHIDKKTVYSETEINGFKIGFLEGTITADTIRKTYPYVVFEGISVPDYRTAAEMIADGALDAFIDDAVSDPAFEEYSFIHSFNVFPMIHVPVSMMTANPELAPIISVVNKYISAGWIEQLYDLYKENDLEYARYKLQRMLVKEERAYIESLKRRGGYVNVAVEYDNYPVNFYNEKEKQFQGIALDVLAGIGRLVDIDFKWVTGKENIWADIYEEVKSGDVPMAAELLFTKEREGQFLWSEVPYSRSSYAILSRADFPNILSYQIIRYKVGVLRQSSHGDIYHELFPDNANLVEYDTVEECLDALENGEVDLLMASEHVLLMQTNYRERTGLKINLRLNVALDSYFGFNKDEEILCSIIDKAQVFIQTDIIETDWMGRAFDYSKKIVEQRAAFLTGFVSVLIILLAVTIVLLVRLMALRKKLEDIASHDVLTGILNRRYFMELGVTQIDRSARLKRECFLMIFDLDHFKVVNDTYGHQAGDKVLKDIAQRVKNSVRLYDLFGRYGGEEFIILMFDTSKADVISATERIRKDICASPVVFEGKEIPISASFGIASVMPHHDIDLAIKWADEALYNAKATGRNKVSFHGDEQINQ